MKRMSHEVGRRVFVLMVVFDRVLRGVKESYMLVVVEKNGLWSRCRL